MTAKHLVSTVGLLSLSVSGCINDSTDEKFNTLNQESHFVPNPLCAGPGAMPPTWDPRVHHPRHRVLRQLAPTGTLRVGVYYGNMSVGICTPTAGRGCTPVYDPNYGVLSGPAVDFTCRLATRLRIPLEFSGYPTIPAFTDGWNAGGWELGFASENTLPIIPGIAIAHSYLNADNTFLVPATSSFQFVADLDQPGVNIVVQFGNAPDAFMRANFVNAQLIELVTNSNATDIFPLVKSGVCDTALCVSSGYGGVPIHASAGGRGGQTVFQLGNPGPWPTSPDGGRVLDETLILAALSPFIAPNNPDALCYLDEYLEAARRSGMLQALIDRLPFRTIGTVTCSSDPDCPNGEVCSVSLGRCGLPSSFGSSVPPPQPGCN